MTEPKLLATFGKPFKYQVAAFRLRLTDLRDTARWTDLWQAEHDRAFMVAGATKAGILSDLAAAVDKAIAQGTGLDAFKRDFNKIVAEKGWKLSPAGQGKDGKDAWRARLIYRTNMSTSYAAGRLAQLVEANYPFWVYRHGASLEPREQHLAWDGLILPPDHPFWATHAPPNGWGCSCYVVGARSMTAAKILGGKPDLKLPDNWQALDPRTGAPVGIDKGWAYAPGASVAKDIAEIIAPAVQRTPAELGSALAGSMDELIDAGWRSWVSEALAGAATKPGFLGAISPSVISALEGIGRKPLSAEIMVQPGLLSGPKAERHARSGDAFDPTLWDSLPSLLRAPRAVFVDKNSNRIIFVLEGSDPVVPQIALALDYRVRADRQTMITNMVVSAYKPSLPDLIARLKGGLLQLVLGELK